METLIKTTNDLFEFCIDQARSIDSDAIFEIPAGGNFYDVEISYEMDEMDEEKEEEIRKAYLESLEEGINILVKHFKKVIFPSALENNVEEDYELYLLSQRLIEKLEMKNIDPQDATIDLDEYFNDVFNKSIKDYILEYC